MMEVGSYSLEFWKLLQDKWDIKVYYSGPFLQDSKTYLNIQFQLQIEEVEEICSALDEEIHQRIEIELDQWYLKEER